MEDAKKGQKKSKVRRTALEQHKRRIVERMKALGTYKVQYMATISRLAELYIQMAEVEKQYKTDGAEPVVEHTNKAGATNVAMSPYLSAMLQMSTQALAHERELGLTPTAMKKLGGNENQTESKLGAALRMLGG